MGEYKSSIYHHFNRKNTDALERIANDLTIDDDDRKLAEELLNKLKNDRNNREER